MKHKGNTKQLEVGEYLLLASVAEEGEKVGGAQIIWRVGHV